MKKFVSLVAVSLIGSASSMALAEPAPTAAATAAATPAVGATVFDPQGGEVGKITSVANGVAVIDTGKHKATVEFTSIAAGKPGPVIGYNRDQLNAAVEAASAQAAAALDAALVAGAEIKSQDGVAIGTVSKVDPAGTVVVERAGGKPVALPKDTLTMTNGTLSLLFTAAQFDEVVGKAAAGPAPAATASTAPAEAPATKG